MLLSWQTLYSDKSLSVLQKNPFAKDIYCSVLNWSSPQAEQIQAGFLPTSPALSSPTIGSPRKGCKMSLKSSGSDLAAIKKKKLNVDEDGISCSRSLWFVGKSWWNRVCDHLVLEKSLKNSMFGKSGKLAAITEVSKTVTDGVIWVI